MRRMSKLVMMVTSRHWCRTSDAGGSRLTPGVCRLDFEGIARQQFAALSSTGQDSLTVGLLGGRTRWPVSGRPVTVWVRGLPHLDQMTVGIADVAADLVLVLLRRSQELSTPGAPIGVHRGDVFDPDIEEGADPVKIAWRLQGDRWLVVGRASADVDDDPGVGQRDIGQPSGAGEDHPAAEYFGVEAPGALDIVRDDEVSQRNSLWARWELGHLAPPLLNLTPHDGVCS